MSPAVVELEVFGEKQVSRELMRFGDRALMAQPAMEAIAERMQEQIREQFDSEGTRGSGAPWPALKPATLAKKAALGQDMRILRATGLLFDTLTGDAGGAWHVDPQGLELHTGDAWYGIFHQKGAPRANVPVRKPVDFTEMDRQEFVKILQEYLMEGLE